jgi:hypothetical protein
MSFRPALVDPQGGPITGKEGGPMSLAKPAINWSHVAGKRQTGRLQKFAVTRINARSGVPYTKACWRVGCGRERRSFDIAAPVE